MGVHGTQNKIGLEFQEPKMARREGKVGKTKERRLLNIRISRERRNGNRTLGVDALAKASSLAGEPTFATYPFTHCANLSVLMINPIHSSLSVFCFPPCLICACPIIFDLLSAAALAIRAAGERSTQHDRGDVLFVHLHLQAACNLYLTSAAPATLRMQTSERCGSAGENYWADTRRWLSS